MKKIFLLLTVSLLLTTLTYATDYMVSGAGTAAVNGTYTPDGTNMDGNPRWKLSGGLYYLHSNGFEWVINADPNMAFMGFYNNSTSSDVNIPPFTGWGIDMGDSPAPTVGLAGPGIGFSSAIFTESSANDGSIDNSQPVIITHNNLGGETFTGSDGDNFVADAKVLVTNLPVGLTAVITKTSATTLSVTLTGNATSNNNANDISNLTFAFQDAAFSSGNASTQSNATKSDISVDFLQIHEVASSGGDYTTIAAAIAAASVGDIINVSAETFTEAGISIDKNITIQGQGAASTVVQAHVTEGSATNGVFILYTGITVIIKNLTIRHGKTGWGGGIYIDNADLTLLNTTICNNRATGSQGGGGIYNGGNGTLNITNCTINNNSATLLNSSTRGGGIYDAGTSTITNSTIYGNTTAGTGGGAIKAVNTTLNNCTVTNNSSGIWTNYGTLTFSNTILADNGSSDYHIEQGINTFNDNGNNIVENQTYSGSPTNWQFSATTNILYNYTANGTVSTSWNRNNAVLANQNLNISATLADNNTLNGTQTLALTSGSFAIDAGTASGAPTTDQRGAGRNGTTDIGAYEYYNDDGALPVELTSFSASVNGSSVVLNWQTATEVNNYGFEIQRNINLQGLSDPVDFETIGFVEGHGNSNSPKEYTFVDDLTDITSDSLDYRLKQIDTDGKSTYYGTIVKLNLANLIGNNKESIPTEFGLFQNYPNPFNPTTTIKYILPIDSKVVMEIYNILGEKVMTLINQEIKAGFNEVNFNARNLSSGIYIYSIRANEFNSVKKMLLVK